ncbi:MAG: hypothetical protein DWG80_04765, partial [Chloroflexi bacterium]|nr:hypothetical protein [Chloroflexota bacterium]
MNLMFWQRKAQDAAATPEERTRELLSAYLDGELTAPQQAEATALIERDPDARAELDDLAMLVSALGNLGAELRAPRSFAITAPAAGSAAGAPWATFRRVEVFFRASAATAALVFVAVLFGAPVSDTPVATAPTAAMSEMTSMAAEAPPAAALMPADAARSADGAGPAPSLAPMPEQTPDAAGGAMGTTGAANEPPQSGPGEAAPVEGAATLALPGPTAA